MLLQTFEYHFERCTLIVSYFDFTTSVFNGYSSYLNSWHGDNVKVILYFPFKLFDTGTFDETYENETHLRNKLGIFNEY